MQLDIGVAAQTYCPTPRQRARFGRCCQDRFL